MTADLLFLFSEISMFALLLINSFKKSKVTMLIAVMIIVSLVIAIAKIAPSA